MKKKKIYSIKKLDHQPLNLIVYINIIRDFFFILLKNKNNLIFIFIINESKFKSII